MKKCIFGFLITLATLPALAVDLTIDTTLGSIVGENATPYNAQLPFHAGLELTQELPFGISVGATAGHQSSADRNGNEYNGEYYGPVARIDIGSFYGKAKAFKFYDNNDEPEGNTAARYEVGVSDLNVGIPIRLGLWFQESDNYQAQGVNLGYTFSLF